MDNTLGSKTNPIVIDSSEDEEVGSNTEESEVAAKADSTGKQNSNAPTISISTSDRNRHNFKRPKLSDSNKSSGKYVKSPFRLFATIQDEKIRKNGLKLADQGQTNSPAAMTLSQSDLRSRRLAALEGHVVGKPDEVHQSLPVSESDSYLEYCLTLRQFMGVDEDSTDSVAKGPIEWIVIVNFIIDFDFLLDEVPELVSIPKVIFFFQVGDPTQYRKYLPNAEFYRIDPSQDPSSDMNPLRHKFPFGTHRKLLILMSIYSLLMYNPNNIFEIQIPKCFWLGFKGFLELSSIPPIYYIMIFISKPREHTCKTFH